MTDKQTTGSGMLMPPQYYDDCSWQHWPPERRAAFDELCRTLHSSAAQRQEDAAMPPSRKDEQCDDS